MLSRTSLGHDPHYSLSSFSVFFISENCFFYSVAFSHSLYLQCVSLGQPSTGMFASGALQPFLNGLKFLKTDAEMVLLSQMMNQSWPPLFKFLLETGFFYVALVVLSLTK